MRLASFLEGCQKKCDCLKRGAHRFLPVQPPGPQRFLTLAMSVAYSSRDIPLCLEFLTERRESLIKYVLQAFQSKILLRNMLVERAILLKINDDASLHCGVV